MKEMTLHIWKWNNNGLFSDYQTIEDETNGIIPDSHWSEDGHKNYCRDLMEELKLSNKFI
jgi:hypothetical protein